MGGTFDHLHKGHRILIETALNFSKKVIIGLATKKLLKNKRVASKIEDYKTREKKIITFVQSITDENRVEIIPLEDLYGPPIHEPEYEGIIVSRETYNNAIKINQIREEKGFKPLIIIVIPTDFFSVFPTKFKSLIKFIVNPLGYILKLRSFSEKRNL